MTERGNPGAGPAAAEAVRGERTTAIVHAARSAHARLSSLLAAALMITLGLATLGWYYAHALGRVTRARQQAQSATASRAQSEMPLPSLGRIELPMAIVPPAAAYTPPKPPSKMTTLVFFISTLRQRADFAIRLPAPCTAE